MIRCRLTSLYSIKLLGGNGEMSTQHEDTQNQRLRDLEKRMNSLENQLSELLGKMTTLTQIGKVLALAVGAAIGIDVVPML
jgi:hypothetical protein